MPLFGRREPLHRKLAREGGLEERPPLDTRPPGGLPTGIHGVPRPREWDAVVAVDAPEATGDKARFVALADGSLVVEEGEDVEPLADALEGVLEPPYRAEALRRGEVQWAVGLRRLEVVELKDPVAGDEVTLSLRDGEKELIVDGESVFGTIPELERLGLGRAGSFVLEAARLDGSLWEVRIAPL